MKTTALAAALAVALTWTGAASATGAPTLERMILQADQGDAAAMLAAGKRLLAENQSARGVLYLEQAARSGVMPQAAYASTALGQYYERLGGPIAGQAAIDNYRQAAVMGDVSAQTRLGAMLLDRAVLSAPGSTEQSQAQSQARLLLDHAARVGNSSEAAYLLGNALIEGKGLARNSAEAAPYIEIAARGRYPGASYLAGVQALDSGDAARARKALTDAADAGSGQAMMALARAYESGQVLQPDLREAERWSAKAVAANAEGAASLHGVIRQRRAAVSPRPNPSPASTAPATPATSLQYVTPVASGTPAPVSGGNPEVEALRRQVEDLTRLLAGGQAMAQLQEAPRASVAPPPPPPVEAKQTQNQRGLDAHARGDYAEASKLFARAAKSGDMDAMNNLGMLYLQGLGVAQDVQRALDLFRSAAELGHVTAAHNVGYVYENGIGVRQDLARSRVWYKHSAVLRQRSSEMGSYAGL